MKKPRRNPLVRINPSPCPRVTIPLSNPTPLPSFSPQLYDVRESQFLRIPHDRTPEVSILPSGGHFVSDVARVIYPSYFPFVLCLRSVGCFWICTPGSD